MDPEWHKFTAKQKGSSRPLLYLVFILAFSLGFAAVYTFLHLSPENRTSLLSVFSKSSSDEVPDQPVNPTQPSGLELTSPSVSRSTPDRTTVPKTGTLVPKAPTSAPETRATAPKSTSTPVPTYPKDLTVPTSKPNPHPEQPTVNLAIGDLSINSPYQPRGYNATLKLYIPGYGNVPQQKISTFEAEVTMKLSIPSERGIPIVLNAKNLFFDERKTKLFAVSSSLRVELGVRRMMIYPADEKIVLIFDDENLENVDRTTHLLSLSLSYVGEMSDSWSSIGLFQANYTLEDGSTQKTSVVTQFEPMEARRVFPCIDQPNSRDIWTITIVQPKETTAIANGKEIETLRVDTNFVSTSFEPTPLMPAYILAIFVSEFQYVEGKTRNNVQVRVWTRPQLIEDSRAVLAAAIKTLDFFENLLQIPYEMNKMDIVAVTEFSFGGMENWGLVVYRENYLLFSGEFKQQQIIAHEIAHQWFGNRVTTSFWDKIWLNEGFATFMEKYATNHLNSEFGRHWMQLLEAGPALISDAWDSSHPLNMEMERKNEVYGVFDNISYKKGSAILEMLSSIYGESLFIEMLKNYMRENKFVSTTPELFAEVLQKNTPDSVLGPDGKTLNVQEWLDQWTNQIGYPVLTVTRIDDNRVRIEQSRFKMNEKLSILEKYSSPAHNFTWDVLVKYQTASGSEVQSAWLKRDEPLELECDRSPVFLNVNGTGFYRVNYDKEEWEAVIRHLKENHESMNKLTKFVLLRDAHHMAATGRLQYSQLFDLLYAVRNDKDFDIISAIKTALLSIEEYFTEKEDKELFTRLIQLTETNRRFKSSRGQSKSLIGNEFYTRNDFARHHFATAFSAGMEEVNQLEPAKADEGKKLQEELCSMVETGGEEKFNEMMSWYEEESDSQQRNNYLVALTCTKDRTQLQWLLDAALSGELNISPGNLPSFVRRTSNNAVSHPIMLPFLMVNWQDILTKFGSQLFSLESVIVTCTNVVDSREDLKTLERFYETAEKARDYHTFRVQIEKIEHKLNWRERYSEEVIDIVEQRLNKLQ